MSDFSQSLSIKSWDTARAGAWASKYYEYSDHYGVSEPYYHPRTQMASFVGCDSSGKAYFDENAFRNKLQDCYENGTMLPLYWHYVDGTETAGSGNKRITLEMYRAAFNILQEYVDAGKIKVINPSEYYEKHFGQEQDSYLMTEYGLEIPVAWNANYGINKYGAYAYNNVTYKTYMTTDLLPLEGQLYSYRSLYAHSSRPSVYAYYYKGTTYVGCSGLLSSGRATDPVIIPENAEADSFRLLVSNIPVSIMDTVSTAFHLYREVAEPEVPDEPDEPDMPVEPGDNSGDNSGDLEIGEVEDNEGNQPGEPETPEPEIPEPETPEPVNPEPVITEVKIDELYSVNWNIGWGINRKGAIGEDPVTYKGVVLSDEIEIDKDITYSYESRYNHKNKPRVKIYYFKDGVYMSVTDYLSTGTTSGEITIPIAEGATSIRICLVDVAAVLQDNLLKEFSVHVRGVKYVESTTPGTPEPETPEPETPEPETPEPETPEPETPEPENPQPVLTNFDSEGVYTGAWNIGWGINRKGAIAEDHVTYKGVIMSDSITVDGSLTYSYESKYNHKGKPRVIAQFYAGGSYLGASDCLSTGTTSSEIQIPVKEGADTMYIYLMDVAEVLEQKILNSFTVYAREK